jgi:two-component system, NarL family, nitrate/nitrite response regulator NarL
MSMTRVLLADDHYLFRELLARVLRQDTNLNEIVQAESLAEVRQLLRSLDGNIDLAIVDFDLPNEEGAEVIKELRAVGVPVLALTLGQSLQGRARAVRAGAAEVLSTTASSEEIIRTAKQLVDE